MTDSDKLKWFIHQWGRFWNFSRFDCLFLNDLLSIVWKLNLRLVFRRSLWHFCFFFFWSFISFFSRHFDKFCSSYFILSVVLWKRPCNLQILIGVGILHWPYWSRVYWPDWSQVLWLLVWLIPAIYPRLHCL